MKRPWRWLALLATVLLLTIGGGAAWSMRPLSSIQKNTGPDGKVYVTAHHRSCDFLAPSEWGFRSTIIHACGRYPQGSTVTRSRQLGLIEMKSVTRTYTE